MGHPKDLATSFTALKRVRPTVPFWHLAAHRIPTLWSLYRGLLKTARHHEHIHWRIRILFHQHKSLTSPTKTRDQLFKLHKWLDVFQKASQGHAPSKALMDRYNRLISTKREREQWKAIFCDELDWITKLKNRPIITGSLMRPTIYNRPLPRLKPQPMHVSGMIHKRRKVRERRAERQEHWASFKDDLRLEAAFESGLYQDAEKSGLEFERIYDNADAWHQPIDQVLASIQASYDLDEERAKTPYSPALLELVTEARREKIRNKTRERERERRGLVTSSTIKRMRKGPPAHILSRLTPEGRRIDAMLRMPSEGGYTGKIKREAGMKLKDNETWKLEDGDPCTWAELDKAEMAFRQIQENRRRKLDVETLMGENSFGN
ncbi:hypothetical protein BU17DRAFT_50473 [Hysterangium stoloniferum]|nr:hypothetical protein BU17DRAFT_50473 [Hysterangium stoloniferum]